MVALQTLKSVNDNLDEIQSAISTGKEVGKAKDNAAVWAISKTMEADISGFEAIEDGLAIGEATVGVASAASEQIVETLRDMKALIVSAQSENVDHGKIQNDIASKVAQIESIISAAQFNGANLLKTEIDGGATTQLGILASLDRAGSGGTVTAVEITIASVNFEDKLDFSASLTPITNSTSAATALGEIETLLNVAITGAAALGASMARLEDQSDFVSNLVDSMTSGVSTMRDTNMEEASARLQALQTQQELAVQSLTIANEAPSTLLQLFQ
jgi:flagellin